MLNLQTNSKPQEIIKAYLEQNATQTLIDKINNGVLIERNGKQLINRKTLDGFMKYASEEAKKLAEKEARSACVEDTVVFGWAMHYFQEDSIEETLFNADGTEYRQNTPTPKTKSPVSQKKSEPSKSEPSKTQYSLFDMMNAKEPVSTSVDDDEPTEEEIREAMQQIDCEQRTTSQTDQLIFPVYTPSMSAANTAQIAFFILNFLPPFVFFIRPPILHTGRSLHSCHIVRRSLF